MSVALNHPLLVFSRNTNHLNGIPHLFFKPLKITAYSFVVSCILSTFKPLDNWSRHWLPDQASGRRVEADCAGTRSGDCHLPQLQNTRKNMLFSTGKNMFQTRFLVSFQSGFQGCRKEKKNLHIILLDCNYFNYTCEDTRLIVFSYGHGLCCILRLLIHAAYIRAGRVTLNPKSRNLIMLKWLSDNFQ